MSSKARQVDEYTAMLTENPTRDQIRTAVQSGAINPNQARVLESRTK